MAKWLICAFHEETDASEKLDFREAYLKDILQKDITKYSQYAKNGAPRAPGLDEPILWFDVDWLVSEKEDFNPTSERQYSVFISNRVTDVIEKALAKSKILEEDRGVVLILDKGLFAKKGLSDLAERIILSEFFHAYRCKNYLVCCYEGVEINEDKKIPSERDCPTGGFSCEVCNDRKSVTTAVSCRHTCYWRLVGYMLGAYGRPLDFSLCRGDAGILNALPKTYIYHTQEEKRLG